MIPVRPLRPHEVGDEGTLEEEALGLADRDLAPATRRRRGSHASRSPSAERR